MKKILFLGLLTLGVVVLGAATLATDGTNYISVNSCEQIGNDIRINGQTLLPSTCRNAGHGYRQYKMTCVSNTQYKVEWTEGCTPITPVVQADVTAPRVSVYSNKSSYNSGDTVYITARASDNRKVVKLELYKDGNLIKTENNKAILTYSFSTKNIYGVNYSFYAKAYDDSQNVGTSKTITANVKPAPTPKTYVWVVDGGQNGKRQIKAKTTGCGVNDSVARVEIYDNNSLATTCYGGGECSYWLTNNTASEVIHDIYARGYCAVSGQSSQTAVAHIGVAPLNAKPTVTTDARYFKQGGVNYIELKVVANHVKGINNIEIYWGKDNNKSNDNHLIKKCNGSGAGSYTCTLAYPAGLSSGGWWWARVWYNGSNNNYDTDLNYYLF